MIALSETSLDARLAAHVQTLRLNHGWTLDDLAVKSGLSRATLSRIERAETSPTAAQLGRLCTAFGMTMSQLLGALDAPATDLVHKADQPVWTDPATGFRRRMVSPPARDYGLELIESELPPGADITYAAPPLNGIEQHIWMLSGYMVFSHADTSHSLKAGDCLRSHLHGVTRFQVPGPVPARYLVVIARP